MVGTSPGARTRGIGLSFDFESGKVEGYQRRGNEWDRVLEVDPASADGSKIRGPEGDA
jgi:hypothetical protein